MRLLVIHGSKRGGTEGIAERVARGLEAEGIEVTLAPAKEAPPLAGYDGVVIGGALYMNRWHRDAARFVRRNARALRQIPTWLFSSGPLDDSADHAAVPPAPEVAVLMERVGALGHVTFGGRLEADARGFPAREMAKTQAGDWRNPASIEAWVRELALVLPDARPGPARDPTARAWSRIAGFVFAAAGITALAVGLLIAALEAALVARVFLVPALLGLLAHRYFAPRGALEPLPVAATLALAAAVTERALLFATGAVPSLLGGMTTTLVLAGLVFGATWVVGFVHLVTPLPKLKSAGDGHGRAVTSS